MSVTQTIAVTQTTDKTKRISSNKASFNQKKQTIYSNGGTQQVEQPSQISIQNVGEMLTKLIDGGTQQVEQPSKMLSDKDVEEEYSQSLEKLNGKGINRQVEEINRRTINGDKEPIASEMLTKLIDGGTQQVEQMLSDKDVEEEYSQSLEKLNGKYEKLLCRIIKRREQMFVLQQYFGKLDCEIIKSREKLFVLQQYFGKLDCEIIKSREKLIKPTNANFPQRFYKENNTITTIPIQLDFVRLLQLTESNKIQNLLLKGYTYLESIIKFFSVIKPGSYSAKKLLVGVKEQFKASLMKSLKIILNPFNNRVDIIEEQDSLTSSTPFVSCSKLPSNTLTKITSTWLDMALHLSFLKFTFKFKIPCVTWITPGMLSNKLRSIEESNEINAYTRRQGTFLQRQNINGEIWPDTAFVRPGVLIAAGFSYTGIGTEIYCDTCGFETNIRNWSQDDEDYAFEIHSYTTRQCQFLLVFGTHRRHSTAA